MCTCGRWSQRSGFTLVFNPGWTERAEIPEALAPPQTRLHPGVGVLGVFDGSGGQKRCSHAPQGPGGS